MQVPMVGKGVVESMLRVFGAVQGGGAEALAVQKAACITLQNLAIDADNHVRGLVAGRCARAGCGCGLGWVPAAMHRRCGCLVGVSCVCCHVDSCFIAVFLLGVLCVCECSWRIAI
jgi:hypothetical protein